MLYLFFISSQSFELLSFSSNIKVNKYKIADLLKTAAYLQFWHVDCFFILEPPSEIELNY